MATNLVYRNSDSQNRVEDLGVTLAPGKPVLSMAIKPAVTVTGSADYVKSNATDYAPMTISGIPAGGVGLTGKQVTLAFDGTWEFSAAGFANTAPDPLTATQGTLVYADETSAGAATLTTTSGGNTLFGYMDFPPDYDRTRGLVPVRIGA